MSDYIPIIVPVDDVITIDLEVENISLGDRFLDELPDLLTIYNQAKSDNSKEITND